jgi:hypothetical protein
MVSTLLSFARFSSVAESCQAAFMYRLMQTWRKGAVVALAEATMRGMELMNSELMLSLKALCTHFKLRDNCGERQIALFPLAIMHDVVDEVPGVAAVRSSHSFRGFDMREINARSTDVDASARGGEGRATGWGAGGRGGGRTTR